MRTVAPLNSSEMSFWMVSSVMTSMLAVASSSKTILLFLRIALTIQRSYFSPTARLPPFSVTLKLRPAFTFSPLTFEESAFSAFSSSSGAYSFSRRYSSLAFFSSSMMRSSGTSLKGSKLYLKDPVKSVGS